MANSIYLDIYTILHTYIYGGVELTADMSLTLTLLSTAACVFAVALPFIAVRWLLRGICR